MNMLDDDLFLMQRHILQARLGMVFSCISMPLNLTSHPSIVHKLDALSLCTFVVVCCFYSDMLKDVEVRGIDCVCVCVKFVCI